MTLHNTTCPMCAERARGDAILAFTNKQSAINVAALIAIKQSNMNDTERRAAVNKVCDDHHTNFTAFFDNMYKEIRASYGLAADGDQ